MMTAICIISPWWGGTIAGTVFYLVTKIVF